MKSSNIIIENNIDSEGAPSLIQIEKEQTFSNNESYSCTNCQSNIEILNIDKNKIKITFKCLNGRIEDNHGIKTLPIREYINLMTKNTYLYNNCSICKKIQNDEKKKYLFNFCVNCEEIICNDCLSKHSNNRNVHYYIKNNQKSILCLLHPGNKNIEYCLKCNSHLCLECLKSGKHVMHRKNNLIEVKPTEEKINIVKAYINSLRNKKQKLEIEKENKSIYLYNKLIKDKKNILNKYKKFIKEKNLEFKCKIDVNRKYLINQLKDLKRQYENNIKLKLDAFNAIIKNLTHKYKILIENYNIAHNKNNIDKIDVKYKNDKNFFLTYYNKQINDINDLLDINVIVRNTQEKYEDNYYNNINFSSLLSCSGKSDESYQKKLKTEFEKEEKLIIEIENLKNELSQLKLVYQNELIKKEEEIKNIKNDDILKENENLRKEKKDITNKYSELLKEFEIIKEEKEKLLIQKNEINKTIEKMKKIHSIKYPKESKDLPKSYAKYPLNNVFCVFNSIENIPVLVYATKDKSIKFLDISKEQQINEIFNAHSSFISNLRYNFDDSNKKDLILSISTDIEEIKVWDANKYECLIKINNIYKKGNIYSSCFLNYEGKPYIITSNFHPTNNYPIYAYDLNGKRVKTISQSNNKIKLIDTFYYNKNKNISNFIICSNENNIKSFNYNNNFLYNKYSENDDNEYSDFIINDDDENIIKLIELVKKNYVKIWNFDTAELLSKIKIDNNELNCLCEWEENLIFIGCEDKHIILVDLLFGEIITKLKGHNNQVCCLKKIKNSLFGSYLISQSKGSDLIKLWS